MFKAKSGDYSEDVISNDAFWPDIHVDDFQRRRSIPPDIDQDQVASYLLAAVTEINDELADYVADKIAAGYQTAADVPGVHINNENQLTNQYKKAVYARAKADLIGEFASISRREAHTAQDAPDTVARLLAESSFVLRSIKGYPRIGVSLI